MTDIPPRTYRVRPVAVATLLISCALAGGASRVAAAARKARGAKKAPEPRAPKGMSWHNSPREGFRIARPQGWKRGKVSGKVCAQYYAKNKNAFFEVFVFDAKRPAELASLADAWVDRTGKQMPGVFRKKSTESKRTLGCGTPALFRKYNGSFRGTKVTARVIFAAKGGRACVALGIYVDAHSKSFKPLIMRSVTSLRLEKS